MARAVAAPAHSPGISRRTIMIGGAGAGAGVAVAAAAGGWWLLAPAARNDRRIAVLPFANLSGDRNQDYFAEGIAEELRSALSRIGMQVIGRASCDAVKDLDTAAAAAKLGVANILTGSVRRSSDTIRINAQLLSGRDGVEQWAQSYDRAPGDAIRIQTDIAQNVAQALRIALGQAARAALTLGGTADSVAQDLFLQAQTLRRLPSRDSFRKTLALVASAIAQDPNYADAYVARAAILVGYAANYSTNPAEAASLLVSADQAARRALAIAPRLGSAYAELAIIDQTSLKFRDALKHLQQAIALAPDDPNVLSPATYTLPYLGKSQQALQAVDRLMALDPLNPRTYRRQAEVLYSVGQYPQTVEAGRKALALGPNPTVHYWIGLSLLMQHRDREALAEFKVPVQGDMLFLCGQGIVAARAGDDAGTQRLLDAAQKEFGVSGSYQYAQINAQWGRKDQAFTHLDNALAARDPGLIYLRTDPLLSSLRGDPRFAALVKKLDFP